MKEQFSDAAKVGGSALAVFGTINLVDLKLELEIILIALSIAYTVAKIASGLWRWYVRKEEEDNG